MNTPAFTASRKLQSLSFALRAIGSLTFFRCRCRTPPSVPTSRRARIEAGHDRVPGIEEQLELVAGIGEQPLELRAGLHHGAHVVMIDGSQVPIPAT